MGWANRITVLRGALTAAVLVVLLVSVARRAALFGDARYVLTTGNSLRYATFRAGIRIR